MSQIDASWRQGSIAAEALATTIRALAREVSFSNQELFVLVSHDCAIHQPSFEKEPLAEFVAARLLANGEVDANLTHAKNPRRLHIPVGVGDDDGSGMMEVFAGDRVLVDRRNLEGILPRRRIKIDDRQRAVIADWLGRRYYRTAFADAFNHRLAPRRHDIRDLAAEYGDRVQGIYLLLNNVELSDEKTYFVNIRVALTSDDYASEAAREDGTKLALGLSEVFDACDGISVNNAEVVSLGSMSVEDAAVWERFDSLDDLSVRSETERDKTFDVAESLGDS